MSVHPHVRGEHFCKFIGRKRDIGSSPRAWGALHDARYCALICRFIPTCVGSMGRCDSSRPTAPVHPHVRGEHGEGTGWLPASNGSSPRAWGAWTMAKKRKSNSRFIPTCVGSIVTLALSMAA